MLITVLKSKIHRATVTDANLEYTGSITIDTVLLEKAGILPYEKVQVVNLNNGERFETYAIEGESGSGVIALNGAAARLGLPGDRVIIMAYGMITEGEARGFKPRVTQVDSHNRVLRD
ncbi:MAG: aspartate 1-decarboxylase [Desulforudis sp.]|nr:aspartate 1-decarboxylase [Clostridia bacterium]MDQ7791913.1 aspartate 1-decarboxylase [Clostridia bacterium]RJX22252.1 MAG: aspartate 1-decarboxylase [Desulforudis sp.]